MAEPLFPMAGKVVAVTGASRGIGRGLALWFAGQGAHVVAMARDLEQLQQLAREIRGAGGECSVQRLDVRDVPGIRAAFDAVAGRLGRIDVLVNNAGMGHPVPALEVTEADWDEMIDLNLKGTFFCAQAAARHMLAAGRGRIVNLSSQLAVVANDQESVYCASKGGVNQLTRCLALEWSALGVTVNAVGPTFTYTPGTRERLDDPAFRAGVLARIPRGRMATIEDIARAVQYLAADATDMVTGVFLPVDGGWTIA
jgi:NAD(P)-dependent dehydrogenase (short-subunit alcohol dehydrogenase family)